MSDSTHHGFSVLGTLGAGIAMIMVLGVIYYGVSSLPTGMPSEQPALTSHAIEPEASSTPIADTVASTTEQTVTNTYTNKVLGLSFNYPLDFSLKSESFTDSTSPWQASFHSTRGDINLTLTKGTSSPSELKAGSQLVRIGLKEGITYDTESSSCNATGAQTIFDSDYLLTITFQSCSKATSTLYYASDDISAILKSFSFKNNASRIYINPKLGFVFRYPSTLVQPAVTTTQSETKLIFTKDLMVTSGTHYSEALGHTMTIDEMVKEAMTASSTAQEKITLGDKPANLVTTILPNGTPLRTVYAPNKTMSDVIVASQLGADTTYLDLIISSFAFIH